MPKTGIYRHYKGNIYRLLMVARHSETLEEMIIYQDVNCPEKIWARPAHMWEETVEVNGERVPRFGYIGGDAEPEEKTN